MSDKVKCSYFLFDKVFGFGVCSKTGIFCCLKDCPFKENIC